MSAFRIFAAAACAIGVAVLLILATGAVLRAAVEPPNPKDLTQGTWELNLQKSKYCPTNARGGPARPSRGGARVISDLGWGMIAVQQIGVNEKGERTGENRISYVLRYDGQKYPAGLNGPSAEGIAWKLVNPRRVEFAHYTKDGTITAEYVRTVTEDGQEMTQTTKFPARECVDYQVFDRKPDGPRRLLAESNASLRAAVQPLNPKDLTQGTWELNLRKTKLCPGTDGNARTARPGGRILTDVGWGLIVTQWIDTNEKGERYGEGYPSYVQRYDGEKYPAGKYYNRPSSEGITWKLVNPNRVEFEHWSMDGKITSTYVRTVSADGQEMTQTTKRPNQDCTDSQVFDRKPGGQQ